MDKQISASTYFFVVCTFMAGIMVYVANVVEGDSRYPYAFALALFLFGLIMSFVARVFERRRLKVREQAQSGKVVQSNFGGEGGPFGTVNLSYSRTYNLFAASPGLFEKIEFRTDGELFCSGGLFGLMSEQLKINREGVAHQVRTPFGTRVFHASRQSVIGASVGRAQDGRSVAKLEVRDRDGKTRSFNLFTDADSATAHTVASRLNEFLTQSATP